MGSARDLLIEGLSDKMPARWRFGGRVFQAHGVVSAEGNERKYVVLKGLFLGSSAFMWIMYLTPFYLLAVWLGHII